MLCRNERKKKIIHWHSENISWLNVIFLRGVKSRDAAPRRAGWWARASFHIRILARRPSMGVIKTNWQCFHSLSQTNAIDSITPADSASRQEVAVGPAMLRIRLSERHHTECLLKVISSPWDAFAQPSVSAWIIFWHPSCSSAGEGRPPLTYSLVRFSWPVGVWGETGWPWDILAGSITVGDSFV